jgi:hypothetical protein
MPWTADEELVVEGVSHTFHIVGSFTESIMQVTVFAAGIAFASLLIGLVKKFGLHNAADLSYTMKCCLPRSDGAGDDVELYSAHDHL